MSQLSRNEASAVVRKVRLDNGGLEDKVRMEMPQEGLEVINNLRKKVGRTTRTLAEQIYSKSIRFVFELIQNAEDNKYDIVRAAGREPFLRFNVTPKRILVDSNEDGFSAKDVQSICDTGDSTKIGRGYIGEKGIGFKSVFKIASRVQVQSGPFAFHFNYASDDDGLGMVTPFSSEHEELPVGVRTRFTLTLMEGLDYGSLLKEFTELPDTLLLFLTKLKRLYVSVHDGRRLHERRYEYLYRQNISQGIVVKYNGNLEEERLRFFIRRKTIYELPPAKERNNIGDAEVVLAFPVDSGGTPVIEPQHVCAYLPLRKIGIPFQVQSDFISQASREDVIDNPWNVALRNGVSEVFIEAMAHFAESPSLEYVWPRYLPNETLIDPFWAELREIIIRKLQSIPIIRSHETRSLKCIGQLRLLGDYGWDEEGNPIFRDLSDEIYLSKEYSNEEVLILQKLGLKNLAVDQFWQRLKADLESKASRMKNPLTTASWHTRCARVLLDIKARSPSSLEQLQSFNIVPLQDESWTSIKSGAVFYHNIDDIEIPLDLGLRILAPNTVTHTLRKEVFDAIGVKYCDPSYIKKLIVGKYGKWNNVNLASSVSHLRFLFHTCPENEQPIDKTMFLFDANNDPVYRIRVALGRPEMIIDDVYVDTPGAYNVKAICAKGSSSDAYNVHIIHPAYMAFETATSSLHDLSWKVWLMKHANVFHSPRLIDVHDPRKLSPLFCWIIKKRSKLFLGILKTHWQAYEPSIKTPTASDCSYKATLRDIKLPCTNGEHVPLQDTFVPRKSLLELARDLGAKDDIRFLKLPSDLPDAAPKQWTFLSNFGAGIEVNLDFYLEALRSISLRKNQKESQQRPNLISIYEAIETLAKVDDFNRLRSFFRTERVINAKPRRKTDTNSYQWFQLGNCVYNGPEFLGVYIVLSEHSDFRNSDKCKRLFTSVLQIPDANYSHTLEQISSERFLLDYSNPAEARNRMSQMYRTLKADSTKDINWKEVMEKFENEELIFTPPNGWHAPSQCVWSDHTFENDKFPISHHYSSLKTLFVHCLEVPSPTLKSQIQELQNLCGGPRDMSEKFSNVKTLLKEINHWKPQSQDVQELRGQNVIPIINVQGTEELVKPQDTFAIVDHQKYGEMFKGKVATLAIPFEELRSIRNFLVALGLNTRYMSQLADASSEADNALVNSALSQDFRIRATALVRCAVHHESSKTADGGIQLCNILRRTRVYQSGKITRKVSLVLDGNVLASQSSAGIFHLESDDSLLKVYVPKDDNKRAASYHTELPKQLITHWSIDDEAAGQVIGSTLTAPIGALTDILLESGIPEIPDLQQKADEKLDENNIGDDLGIRDQSFGESGAGNLPSPFVSSTPSSSISGTPFSMTQAPASSRATTPERRSISLAAGRRFYTPEARLREVEEPVAHSEDYIVPYTQLLDKVISSGEKGNLLTQVAFASSDFASSAAAAGDSDRVFGIRSQDMLAHDMRIGAAGELYAFEVLKFRLNAFSLDNWRSNIRHHVSVHHKYNNLTPWTGRETADIVYEDHGCDNLTRLLRSFGYLDFGLMVEETPTYYLEVKTTTGPFDTRFYMSKAQVRRMRQMRRDPSKPISEIYIILRVFNLTSDNIGMRILVDPATMEQEGKLIVEADQYTVLQPRL